MDKDGKDYKNKTRERLLERSRNFYLRSKSRQGCLESRDERTSNDLGQVRFAVTFERQADTW
jgi:hypothetical protein